MSDKLQHDVWYLLNKVDKLENRIAKLESAIQLLKENEK